MKKIFFVAALLLAVSPATAAPLGDWCSGSGQGCIDCPRNCRPKPVHDTCTGWHDAAGVCRHGIGGSGAYAHGYYYAVTR